MAQMRITLRQLSKRASTASCGSLGEVPRHVLVAWNSDFYVLLELASEQIRGDIICLSRPYLLSRERVEISLECVSTAPPFQCHASCRRMRCPDKECFDLSKFDVGKQLLGLRRQSSGDVLKVHHDGRYHCWW